LDIELGDLSVLIGPNASGKSNFVEILRFLKDISAHGLANAVSMQGGMEYLKNINAKESDEVFFKIVWGVGRKTLLNPDEENERLVGAKNTRTVYEFSIKSQEDNIVIGKDKVTCEYEFVYLKRKEESFDEIEKIGPGSISLSNVNGKIVTDLDLPPELKDKTADDFVFSLRFLEEQDKDILSNKLLLQTPFFPFYPLDRDFRDISIYNIDPKLSRQSAPITGKEDLEEDGGNLAIVLKNITENEEKLRKFENLVQDLLPFVRELKVERSIDKSLLFSLREIYNENVFLPSHLLSDGTIAITVLLISLYFERNKLCVLEEPFRNIHPALISKVASMLEEAAKDKQIIVTTHNPQMVKHTKLGNLVLISRNEQGESVISKPAEREDVNVFLENEIGLDDLFVQGLLEN